MIIVLTLFFAFSATLLNTLLFTTVSLTHDNKPTPTIPESWVTVSDGIVVGTFCVDGVIIEVTVVWCVSCCNGLDWIIVFNIDLVGSCSWNFFCVDDSKLLGLSDINVPEFEIKLGNALGGATFDNKLPVDVDMPSGINKDVDDDKLLKESENYMIIVIYMSIILLYYINIIKLINYFFLK